MSALPILYNLNISPPVRTVKTIAKLIDVELELRDLDVLHGEHLEEFFVKLNPEHTVPTLDDNGVIIWDSHAISIYLIEKYAADDNLYPRDNILRAKCNQRLFFHNGILLQRFRMLAREIFDGATDVPERPSEQIHEAFRILETFLETDLFLVGEIITLADVCTAITTTTICTLVPIDNDQYPNILDWLNRVREEIPFFDEVNEEHSNEYGEILKATMERNQQND